MNYTAQLIVKDKVVDTITVASENPKIATQLFFALGYRHILESDNYKIDIFEEKTI